MDVEELDSRLRAAVAPYLKKPGPCTWSARPIERSAVWNFCEAVEDGNPVYWDEEFAAASRFGRVIAPPQALMSLCMRAWWLPGFLRERAGLAEAEICGPPGGVAKKIVTDFGFGTATNVSREEEYFEPFGPGDGRLGQTVTLVEVSPAKQTRVGLGVFITTTIDYVTEQRSTLVARARNVLLMYDKSTGPDGGVPSSAGTNARPPLPQGQDLPPLRVEVTRTTMAMVVTGTRDLYPIHHDPEFARAAGARDTFVNTMWYQGLLGRYATDWGGPESFVRKLSFDMRAVNCPGDTLTVRGRVLRVTPADGVTLVELDIRIDNQLQRDSVTGRLTLELASVAGSAG